MWFRKKIIGTFPKESCDLKELAKVISSEDNVPLIAVEIRKLVKPQYMFFSKFLEFCLLNSNTVDINLPMRKCLKTSLFAIFVIFTSLTSENTEVSKSMFNIEGVSRTLLVLFSFCHFAKCVFLYFWLDYHFTKVLKRTPSLDDTERKRRSI